MSKLVYNKIAAKLQRLDEYVRYLTELQKISQKDFISLHYHYGLAERYLQLSIEILLDIGKLIVLSEGFEKPEDNQEIFSILRIHKILSIVLISRISGIAGFRNVLVHDYEKIDREIIFEKLKNNLDDFILFKKEILKYLHKKY